LDNQENLSEKEPQQKHTSIKRTRGRPPKSEEKLLLAKTEDDKEYTAIENNDSLNAKATFRQGIRSKSKMMRNSTFQLEVSQ